MMTQLQALSTEELVGIYNGLADKPLKSWRRKRELLIERIENLRTPAQKAGMAETENQLGEGGYGGITSEVTEDAPTEDIVTDETGNDNDARTIRIAALELLCLVDHYENRDEKSSPENRVAKDHPKARSVGIPYLEIISRIQVEFPDCETSVACLRWYAVKVRAEEFGYEGWRLCQRRPRAKPGGA